MIFFALSSQISKIDSVESAVSKNYDEYVNIHGTVISVETNEDFLSIYSVKLDSINEKKINANALAVFEYNAALSAGSELYGSFKINNVDQYAENESYYLADGITLYLHSPTEYFKGQTVESFKLKMAELNSRISKSIRQKINGESGDLVSALILGNKDNLDATTKMNFRRAGLSHILAISGMHLSILMFSFDFVLKKLRLTKIVRGGVIILAAFCYLCITGFNLSTVRAFIMSTFVYFAFVMQDDNDMLTSLLFSLFLIIAINPFAVYDIGLWLSFLAVLGIFTAQHFIEALNNKLFSVPNENTYKYALKRRRSRLSVKGKKFIIYLFSAAMITLFANIFICIPTWLFFDEISLIALPANLLLAPIATILLYLTPLFLIFAPVPYVSDFITLITEKTADILLAAIEYITSFSGITVSLSFPIVGAAAIFVSISLAVFLSFEVKWKWFVFIAPAVASIVFLGVVGLDRLVYENVVEVNYIGETESEALHLRDQDDYIVIDVSTGSYNFSYDLLKSVRQNKATELSAYVLTHYHTKHIQTTQRLLGNIPIERIYLPYPQNQDDYMIMKSIIKEVANRDVDVVIFDANTKTPIGPNVSLSLSEKYFLKRSTHPTFYLTLSAYGENLLYIAESSHDSAVLKESITKDIPSSSYVIFGEHGPIIKTECEYKFTNQKVATSSAELTDSLKGPIYHFFNDVDRIRFSFINSK